MKATEQHFSVVLFIILCNVVLLKSVDEIRYFDSSNESYWQFFSVVLCIMRFIQMCFSITFI